MVHGWKQRGHPVQQDCALAPVPRVSGYQIRPPEILKRRNQPVPKTVTVVRREPEPGPSVSRIPPQPVVRIIAGKQGTVSGSVKRHKIVRRILLAAHGTLYFPGTVEDIGLPRSPLRLENRLAVNRTSVERR